MNYLTLYILLVGAHTIGDYALQSNWIAMEKCKSLYVLFVHTMIWTTTVSIFGLLMGFALDAKMILGVLLIPHFIMDYTKAQSKWFGKVVSIPKYQLAIDQVFHYVQLAVLLYMNLV